MCGRFSLAPEAGVLEALFPDLEVPAGYAGRYNIAPTQSILGVVRDAQGLRYQAFRWGLVPHWARDARTGASMINARAESVASRPAFRVPFRRHRCLVLADGFYEWSAEPGRRGKTPYHIRRRDGRPFAFAGVWDRWKADGAEAVCSAAIITTEANELMARLHDRMPVILAREAYEAWLDCGGQDVASLQALLHPCDSALLEAFPVSTRVNSPRNEGADLVVEALASGVLPGFEFSVG